jgi:hypothetical protein
MGNWSDPSWRMDVGINHTPAYEVSGRPFASGNINAVDEQQVVNFPYVTRWVQVTNPSTGSLQVGFSPTCFAADNSNYFIVPPGDTSGRLEVKVNRLYVKGGGGYILDTDTTVVAGLTSISANKVDFSAGISWSGSYSGVG